MMYLALYRLMNSWVEKLTLARIGETMAFQLKRRSSAVRTQTLTGAWERHWVRMMTRWEILSGFEEGKENGHLPLGLGVARLA